MQKYVYEFTEGGKDEKDLLGGKGANLAEMTRMGLPVPHGFTVTERPYGSAMSKGAFGVLRSSIDPPGRTTHQWSRS